jgi:hypothetical protein
MQEGREEYAGRESRCVGQYKTAQMSIRRMRCNVHFTSRSAEHIGKVKRRRKWLSSFGPSLLRLGIASLLYYDFLVFGVDETVTAMPSQVGTYSDQSHPNPLPRNLGHEVRMQSYQGFLKAVQHPNIEEMTLPLEPQGNAPR